MQDEVDEWLWQLIRVNENFIADKKSKEYLNNYKRKWRLKNKHLVKIQRKKYYSNNRDKEIQRCKNYRNKNKDKISVYNKYYKTKHSRTIKQKYKKWKNNNKDKIKIYDRNKWLKIKFRINHKIYLKMLNMQNNVCFICNNENKNRFLCIDHNHATNKIRKLLCTSCNAGLGNFKENIDIMYKAIKYLKDHKE